MGWPHHLQPLPSIFDDPYMYYVTLEHCSFPHIYQAMKNMMRLELGDGPAYDLLFAHISHDLIDKMLESDTLNDPNLVFPRLLARHFIRTLVQDNHVSYREELLTKASPLFQPHQQHSFSAVKKGE